MALKLKGNQIRKALELDVEVGRFSLKRQSNGECYEKTHMEICAENIQQGLNKAPWPLCLSVDFNYTPMLSISPLNSFFHKSSVLMHSTEEALKPSKHALKLIFHNNNNNKKLLNMENISDTCHKGNHKDYLLNIIFCSKRKGCEFIDMTWSFSFLLKLMFLLCIYAASPPCGVSCGPPACTEP